ncbi:ROK family transcriptional regulator [Luteipulveratus mongoliensis]|uniref:ROK family transcriptional regulator n=2 Tax=Luteipulveratus mongoliensis TaxID=571913 RepID=A0A0K1JDR0_9MICO|nr:ROK family transcriptional regulator [Luteipulveratus mongoliensis]
MLRGINDRAALHLLIEHGPLSRSRLGELTGLSKPTTSQLLTRLSEAGLVINTGNTHGGPGPRAQLYAVNPDAAYAAGLDVTPTRVLAAVTDITGRTVGEYELPTPRRAKPDAVEHVQSALDGACLAAGIPRSRLHRMVIGTPGAFDPSTRRLFYARHLPGWHDARLLDRLAEAVKVPFDVGNDVNLAARAEQSAGRARGVDNFVLLWADEGIGAAIVIAGRIHSGATGGAGEIGFLPLPGTPLVRDVRRGNTGGFQELAGGKQVLTLARSLGIRASTPEAAVTRAHTLPGKGDVLLSTLAERFALGIAALVAVVDPTLVVLAGGILAAGGEPLRDRISDQVGSLAAAHPRLELADVTDHPVLAGALQTAVSATREDVFDTIARRAGAPRAANATSAHTSQPS